VPESGALSGILVADERDENSRTRVFAENGSIVADETERRIRLQLNGGTAVTEKTGVDSYDLTSFGSFEVNLDVARALDGGAERAADMPVDRLIAALGQDDGPARLEAVIEVHRKLAFAAAAMLLALAGVPLAAPVSRSVRSRGLALSIGCALAYYFAFSAAVMLVRRGTVAPLLGLWAPNALLAALVAYAMFRVGRDRPLLPQLAYGSASTSRFDRSP